MTCFPGNQVDRVCQFHFHLIGCLKTEDETWIPPAPSEGQTNFVGRDDSGCAAASRKVALIRTAAPREVYAAYGRPCWPGAAPQARPLGFF